MLRVLEAVVEIWELTVVAAALSVRALETAVDSVLMAVRVAVETVLERLLMLAAMLPVRVLTASLMLFCVVT